MALTTSTITGRVPLPTDEVLQYAELTFALSGLDTQGADVLPGGIIKRVTLVNSELPAGFKLWRNTSGLRGTHYRVLARWTVKDRDGVRDQYADLGIVQVGASASYTLASLINSSVPAAIGTFWSSITQAQYDEAIGALDATIAAKDAAIDARDAAIDAQEAAIDAQEAAELAADQAAALYEGPWFNNLAALVADTTLTYTAGQPGTVDAGDYVRARKEGFAYEVAASGATDNHEVTAGGVKLYRITRQDVEVTVGSGGQFATVNAALAFLDGQRRTYGSGATATVRLLSGFAMAEQVLVDGQGLGWIKIVSDAASVAVDHTAITVEMVDIDGVTPVFGGINGAVLPIIGALFAYASNATAKDGVAVYGGSVAQIEPECGIQRCRRGIQAYNASRVFCNIDGLRSSAGSATSQLGVDFRECSGRALDVQQGSFASLPRSNFNDCGGDLAVYFIWGASGNIYQSSVRRAAGTAILARDASVLCARECDMDQAGERAIHALHGAVIDARSKVAGEGSLFGTFGAKNCLGTIAVLANAASSIDAAELDVSGASARGFAADQGSTINAELANAANCGSFGMIADRASVINANGSITTGCTTGYNANDGSTINARSGTANNCSGFGALATASSRINAHSMTATGCATSVEARDGSNIDARLAVLTGSTSRALSAIDGCELNCQGAVTTGAGSFHLTVRGGCRVAARDFLGNIDLRDGGGIVHNSGGTGTVSQTVNTMTAQGIIFR